MKTNEINESGNLPQRVNNWSFNGIDVRTFEGENGIEFNGQDAAKILGYQNASRAIKMHCKERGITKRYTPTSSGNQEMIYISESNLYRLIAHSNLPAAEQFEAWVFEELLPTVRRDGGYISASATSTQIAALMDKVETLSLRLQLSEAEKLNLVHRVSELEREDVVFGNRTEYGVVNKSGKPRTNPRRATFTAARNRLTKAFSEMVEQLLLPLGN